MRPMKTSKQRRRVKPHSVGPVVLLLSEWRKRATSSMKMSRHCEKESWDAEMASRDAAKRNSHKLSARLRRESVDREHDRYRWQRVAETYRICVKELRRVIRKQNHR